MTEIEQLAQQWLKKVQIPGLYTNTEIFAAGAAAVIELIRERMPGEATAPPDYSKDIWYANGGWNFYRSEILKLLDTIK